MPGFCSQISVLGFNRAMFDIKTDLDWQVVNRLPINLFFYDTPFCSHLFLFYFDSAKFGILADFYVQRCTT
jgi:hypothetical protein